MHWSISQALNGIANLRNNLRKAKYLLILADK